MARGEIGQGVVIEDAGDRITYGAHDLLHGAPCLVGVRTVRAFLIGGLADAADWSKRAIEDANDLAERNVVWRLDQRIAALHAPPAGKKPGPFQGQENLFEELDGDVLASGDIMALQSGLPVSQRQLKQSAKPIFTFLREFHQCRVS